MSHVPRRRGAQSVFALVGLATALLLVGALVMVNRDNAGGSTEPTLNIYSARHYDGDELLYRRFTELTGISVRTLEADADQLIQRIQREGSASPADVLITVDAGRLWRAEDAGVLAPVRSEVLEERIPAHLRHPDGLWFGFSTRLRLIFFNPEQVAAEAISSYEDLAGPHLRGRICLRSSNNVYNQSLLASMLAEHGPEQTAEWTEGLMVNLARPPQGGDTDQIRGVAAGECDVAIANHYYYLRLANSSSAADRDVAERVAVMFPNQDDRGAHLNVGGAGMVRGAPNPVSAVQFLEFLASDEAQMLLAEGNFEFPAVIGSPVPAPLRAMGEFRTDRIPVSTLGQLNAEAIRIADRAGWR